MSVAALRDVTSRKRARTVTDGDVRRCARSDSLFVPSSAAARCNGRLRCFQSERGSAAISGQLAIDELGKGRNSAAIDLAGGRQGCAGGRRLGRKIGYAWRSRICSDWRRGCLPPIA